MPMSELSRGAQAAGRGRRRHPLPRGEPRRVVDAFARLDGDADLSLLAGDLTSHGTVDEAEILCAAAEATAAPVFAVLGNHDWHGGEAEAIAASASGGGHRRPRPRGATVLELEGLEVGLVGGKGFVGGFAPRHLPDFGEPSLRAVYAETTAEVEALDAGPARGRDLPDPHRPPPLLAGRGDAGGRAARDLRLPRQRPPRRADPRARTGPRPARPCARGCRRGPDRRGAGLQRLPAGHRRRLLDDRAGGAQRPQPDPLMKEVRIGCSGWNYKDWREDFYPPRLPASRWLEPLRVRLRHGRGQRDLLPAARAEDGGGPGPSRCPTTSVFAVKAQPLPHPHEAAARHRDRARALLGAARAAARRGQAWPGALAAAGELPPRRRDARRRAGGAAARPTLLRVPPPELVRRRRLRAARGARRQPRPRRRHAAARCRTPRRSGRSPSCACTTARAGATATTPTASWRLAAPDRRLAIAPAGLRLPQQRLARLRPPQRVDAALRPLD